MSVSARLSLREEGLFDEYSVGSVQPSDEWENDIVVDEELIDKHNLYEEENSPMYDHPTVQEESLYTEESNTFNVKKSFFSNQSAIVDYFSNLVPSFSVEGSKITDLGHSFSTETYSKMRNAKPETKAKRSGSSHSRCIVENTEYVQERQDEQNRSRGSKGRGEGHCDRDQNSTSCSVEEISQISEITMDLPTVVPEQKFMQCSALPTISEVEKFDSPQIAAACTPGIRSNAQCSAGADTTKNKSDGNNDFLEYVFDLVEDAMCRPIKTSKSERKKVFMEAFLEESEKVVKLANKNASRDPFRESSKRSKSTTTTKETANRRRDSPAPMDEIDEPVTDQVETSMHSSRKSDHSRMKMVDKPPLRAPGFRNSFPLDDELTMDWSKMMSLAEQQLEAEETSVASKDSRISEISKLSDKSSDFQSVRCDAPGQYDAPVMSDKSPPNMKPVASFVYGTKAAITIDESNAKASVASSVSTSSSTHATMADDVVRELRELSALETSSFEEESRFVLTSSLFRYMGSLIPGVSEMIDKSDEEEEYEERAFDEISVASQLILDKKDEIISMRNQTFYGSNEEFENEEMTLKIARFIAFFYAFVFWPSGIARKQMPHQPLIISKKKRVDSKPTSLLRLVNGN